MPGDATQYCILCTNNTKLIICTYLNGSVRYYRLNYKNIVLERNIEI